MKLKMVLAVVFALVLLLNGCSETNNSKIDVLQEVSEDLGESIACFSPWVSVLIKDSIDFESEIINRIKIPPETDDSDGDYHLYFTNEIGRISSFYNLVNLKIDGYTLNKADINKQNFIYYFESIEEKVESSSILVTITRQDWNVTHYPKIDPYERILETIMFGADTYLTEDNFVYYESANRILAQIGDTIFTISVPEHLADYEYLRDLAFDLIKSAELVKVGE
ncbi:MAG: hypothetical protein FWG83_03115 [Oscillospiraceae bacterium]|nr:hypothetical protein [Oscillospiraceae bacterium]